MARQFEVFRTAGGVLVVVVQSDLLEVVRTRVVVPLLPVGMAGRPMQGLNPEIDFGGETLVLMPQLLASLTVQELGRALGSIANRRDAITRAVDMLLAGV